MDPYQHLIDFSKLLDKPNDPLQNETVRQSVEFLRLDRPREVSAAEAGFFLFQIKDFQEVAIYMERYVDPVDVKAVALRFDSALSRRDKMARKTFYYEKFREAAWKSCKRFRRIRDHSEPFSHFVSRQGTVTTTVKKPTGRHLARVFKYAVKRTILEHKRESGGDPWDEFFYRAYALNRDNMMLEFVRDGSREVRVRETLNIQSTKASKLSEMLRGEIESKREPSPLMKAIGRRALPERRASDYPQAVKDNLEEKNSVGGSPSEKEESTRQRKILRIDVSPSSHPRFRFGKVPHSPDGRTSLTRLFYLPLIDKQPPV